jgi:5-methylcytosine-specific restriction protein B
MIEFDEAALEPIAAAWQAPEDEFLAAELERSAPAFQARFPPERLRALSGRELLLELHGRESRDSLAFWLEFKKDETFSTTPFGSIRGGSALKFRVYQRAEDNDWYAGESGVGERVGEVRAIEIATQQRDQLLKAREVVMGLPADTSASEWTSLGTRIEAAAPDLHRLAFLHKYLHLQRRDVIDDYHSRAWHNHQLLHLGVLPPPDESLYSPARWLVAAWQTFCRKYRQVPLGVFSTILNRVHGAPRNYWRVGTDEGAMWSEMRDGSYTGIGWSGLGELSRIAPTLDETGKKAVLRALGPGNPQSLGRQVNQIWRFYARMKEGDIVVAANGRKVQGVGRVTGPYSYVPGKRFPHQREVEWLTTQEFTAPSDKGLHTTVFPLDSEPEFIREVVRRTRGHAAAPSEVTVDVQPRHDAQGHWRGLAEKLSGLDRDIARNLERKGQVILYGPPGTGKTWRAFRVAEQMLAWATFGKPLEGLSEDEVASLRGERTPTARRLWSCTFHPSYGYEEFVEGLRPTVTAGGLAFEVRSGLFREVCASAIVRPDELFFLIVDELNRGDVPRIFGELLTLIEADKRGKALSLPYSRDSFSVPPNVRIIATMNTADRSIALLDAALRRRFAAVELLPDPLALQGSVAGDIALDQLLIAINRRLVEHLGARARNLQVGHSYFFHGGQPIRDFGLFRKAVQSDLLPLLQEYCYDDLEALSRIVGDLYRKDRHTFADDLFMDGRESELKEALAGWSASIIKTTDAAVGIVAEEEDDG